jgi:hypothetical protein
MGLGRDALQPAYHDAIPLTLPKYIGTVPSHTRLTLKTNYLKGSVQSRHQPPTTALRTMKFFQGMIPNLIFQQVIADTSRSQPFYPP